MRILQTVGAAFAATLVAGLAACDSDTASGPATSSAAASSVAPTPITTSGSETLGPTGYLGIEIGASWAAETARNSGKPIGELGFDGAQHTEAEYMISCAPFRLPNGGSGWLYDGRVIELSAENSSPAIHTPEGIRAGSTLDQVRTAYPTLHLGVNWSSADVPGHPDLRYGFHGLYRTDANTGETVKSLLLYSGQGDGCHN
ncbi:hypothetical protein DFR70_1011021 [Nocardia tenerifensis]|uniref:Lipoprotein n=1 Tax=Nocardia tenerifensis TaxID=228006 RepID=A0A318KCM9_9NOCA|nr:hypothetical protein [Nocardia tenerifensis]PXX71587.1 hypothetical protein DFR70_1011021 [Nocardia tenerifensis]